MKKGNNRNFWNVSVKVIALCFVIVAIFYGVKYWIYTSKNEDTNDASVQAFINPVSARAGGYIKKVLFDEHQFVKAGDTLVILDDIEYKAKQEAAEAALEAASANLVVLEAGIRSAQTGTLVNQDQIGSAEANLWKQKQDIERYKNLLQDEAVTQSDYERVKTQFDIAEKNYEAAKNGLKTSYSKIDELESRRELIKADIHRSEASLDLAKINLSYTVITSPYTGYTGRKNILEGQQVQPGQPLVDIVSENTKWIIANFKETQVRGMYIGQPVDIRIDAFPNKVFKGKIDAIAAATGSEFSLLPTDNSSGNFVKIIKRVPVKIVFDEKDLTPFKAGMNAKVSIDMSNKR